MQGLCSPLPDKSSKLSNRSPSTFQRKEPHLYIYIYTYTNNILSQNIYIYTYMYNCFCLYIHLYDHDIMYSICIPSPVCLEKGAKHVTNAAPRSQHGPNTPYLHHRSATTSEDLNGTNSRNDHICFFC